MPESLNREQLLRAEVYAARNTFSERLRVQCEAETIKQMTMPENTDNAQIILSRAIQHLLIDAVVMLEASRLNEEL